MTPAKGRAALTFMVRNAGDSVLRMRPECVSVSILTIVSALTGLVSLLAAVGVTTKDFQLCSYQLSYF
ncbi:MAG TPA: hypothetical protein PKW52_01645 [Nitrospira sp.]|nr:hypothetical protein [Nitrospira sp. NTP1]HQR15093.1 hypothetical protein [Nitrospira sp.]HQV10016.1 hypothetical protein [Nitrospira sp.]